MRYGIFGIITPTPAKYPIPTKTTTTRSRTNKMENDKSTQFTITNADPSQELTLKGEILSTDGHTTGFRATNLTFTDLFFITMTKMRENEIVPDALKDDIRVAFPLLKIVLQEVKVTLKEDQKEIDTYSALLHNLDRVSISPKGQAERVWYLQQRLELNTITPQEREELSVLGEELDILDPDDVSKWVDRVFLTRGVYMALLWTVLQLNGELQKEEVTEEPERLFPNSKSLAFNQFAMPKILTDSLNRMIKNVSPQLAQEQFNRNNPPRAANPKKNTSFKVRGKETETEIIIDSEMVGIQTTEQFVEKLMDLKNAKVLQTFCALWKWANLKQTPTFRNVPISEVMALILKGSDTNKFNTPQRREFSQVLELLNAITVTVSAIGEQVNKKTGKRGKPVLVEKKGVRMFEMMATYSVKKPYQSLPKEELEREHFDTEVITSFSGQLLPGMGHLFQDLASIYFDSLLSLDANKDSKAFLMGFSLQARFNQLKDKEKCIEVDRGFLIDLCDYARTNQTKPSQATKQLKNNLNKLIKAGIISKYTGLTDNNNEGKVKISPPKSLVPAKGGKGSASDSGQ